MAARRVPDRPAAVDIAHHHAPVRADPCERVRRRRAPGRRGAARRRVEHARAAAVAGDQRQARSRPVGDAVAVRRPAHVADGAQRPVGPGDAAVRCHRAQAPPAPGADEQAAGRPRGPRVGAQAHPRAVAAHDPRAAGAGHEQPAAPGQRAERDPLGLDRLDAERPLHPAGDRRPRRRERRDERYDGQRDRQPYNFFKNNRICLVWNQLDMVQTPPVVTTDFVYLRFIGDRSINERHFGIFSKIGRWRCRDGPKDSRIFNKMNTM